VINLNVLKAQGYSHLFFRLEVIKKVGGTVFLLVGILYYGVLGLAWSQVAFGVVAFFINAFYTGKHLNYGPWKQVNDFMPVLLVSLIMAGVVYITKQYFEYSAMGMLINEVAIGVSVYVLICIVCRVKALQSLISLLAHR